MYIRCQNPVGVGLAFSYLLDQNSHLVPAMKQSSNVHPAAQLIRAFEFMRAAVFFQHPFFSNINFPPAAKLWYHFSLWLIHGQLYCILLLAVTQILDQPSATKNETVGFCKVRHLQTYTILDFVAY